jgi:hypothetical protein
MCKMLREVSIPVFARHWQLPDSTETYHVSGTDSLKVVQTEIRTRLLASRNARQNVLFPSACVSAVDVVTDERKLSPMLSCLVVS